MMKTTRRMFMGLLSLAAVWPRGALPRGQRRILLMLDGRVLAEVKTTNLDDARDGDWHDLLT